MELDITYTNKVASIWTAPLFMDTLNS